MRGLAQDIQREQLTSGSVRYSITDETLGPLGAIRLRKVSDEQTEITIEPPPQPGRRPPTDEVRAMIKELTDIDARRQAISENDKLRRNEQVTHHRWRQATQAAIIQGFIDRFETEREWLEQADEGGCPIASPTVLRFKFNEDTWLWEQVNVHARRLKTVYQEWEKRAADRKLDNPYETAKKIVQKGPKRGV